jgi:hypothetical protein
VSITNVYRESGYDPYNHVGRRSQESSARYRLSRDWLELTYTWADFSSLCCRHSALTELRRSRIYLLRSRCGS